MAKHTYKITVEHVSDQKNTLAPSPPLVFRAENHDDILALAAKLGCADDKSLSFLLGLKLFGEALLEDKENPLYRDFLPHFGSLMKRLKENRGKGRAAADGQPDKAS